MPRLTDLTVVRTLLDRDREWAAYAIGDLGPGLVEQCEWYAPATDAAALLLIYRGFELPILFAMGDAGDLQGLFEEIRVPEISLHVRPEALEAMSGVYAATHTRAMLRMALSPAAFTPVPHNEVQPINEKDLPAVTKLYEDGYQHGEGPTFFTPAMLRQNTFRGVWEGDALVAIAGTHLYSPQLGVCTIGNVYTRSDRRGRGLGARVTAAVVARTIADHIPTIVLNVGRENTVAQRVYARLGFTVYCAFIEGEARRI